MLDYDQQNVDDGGMPRSNSYLAVLADIPAGTDESIKEERGKSLGVKSIGTFLSFIFVINQIYGPGVLAIPLVYTQSGLIPTMFMVTFFLVISSLAATCCAQAIASIPDNRQYQQRVEFGTAVDYFYGHRWHVVFQVCLNITVQAYNIASVVICAQSIDQALVTLSGRTYAFEIAPHIGFHSFDDVDILYSSNHVTISLGYALITLFFLPAGFMNLNDNVKTVQVGSFIFLIILMLEFVIYFIWRGHQDGYHAVPAFGSSYSQLVSVFIFSWAYVIFVPSWLNEKAVETSVNKVIWSAGIASWVGYIAIGWLCAAVFSGSDIGLDNMLVSLEKGGIPVITRVTSHLFSLGVIAPGIPVCSVTTRYNLYVGGICGKRQSYFWGCIAPWIVGFIFCQGEIFANLLNWTSLLFNGLVNFLVPFLMYLTSLKEQQAGGVHSADQERPDGTVAVLTHTGINAEDDNDRLQHMASSYNASTTAVVPADNNLRSPLLANGSDSDGYASPPVASSTGIALVAPTTHSDGQVHFCAPNTDPNFQHGPVYPLPEFLRPYSYQFIVGLVVVTQAVIVAQIIGDVYYAAKGQNILG